MKKKRNNTVSSNALVNIIIPVHNQMDLLEKCLASIPDAFGNIPYEIVIYDNGSFKEEKERLYPTLSKDNKVFIIENKENIGFPRACNIAARRRFGKLLFFLNSDVILSPGAGELLVKEMEDTTVGVTGMRLIFPDYLTPGLDSKIRPAGKLQHICLSVDIRGRLHHAFVGWDADHPKVMALAGKNVPAVTGAAFMTTRNLWNKIGGFFEGYGLGTHEDVDFCFSVSELGYNIRTVPMATGLHYTSATAEKFGIHYPLQQNYNMFLVRWGRKLAWTDPEIL